MWRREAGRLLCNACGIYLKSHGCHRPTHIIRAYAPPAAASSRWNSPGPSTSLPRAPAPSFTSSCELSGPAGLLGRLDVDTATSPPHRRHRKSPSLPPQQGSFTYAPRPPPYLHALNPQMLVAAGSTPPSEQTAPHSGSSSGRSPSPPAPRGPSSSWGASPAAVGKGAEAEAVSAPSGRVGEPAAERLPPCHSDDSLAPCAGQHSSVWVGGGEGEGAAAAHQGTVEGGGGGGLGAGRRSRLGQQQMPSSSSHQGAHNCPGIGVPWGGVGGQGQGGWAGGRGQLGSSGGPRAPHGLPLGSSLAGEHVPAELATAGSLSSRPAGQQGELVGDAVVIVSWAVGSGVGGAKAAKKGWEGGLHGGASLSTLDAQVVEHQLGGALSGQEGAQGGVPGKVLPPGPLHPSALPAPDPMQCGGPGDCGGAGGAAAHGTQQGRTLQVGGAAAVWSVVGVEEAGGSEDGELTVQADPALVAAVLVGMRQALSLNQPQASGGSWSCPTNDFYLEGGAGAAGRGRERQGGVGQGEGPPKRRRSPAPGGRAGSREGGGRAPSASMGEERAMQVCVNCGTTKTPLWRKDKETGESNCNACGIYKQTHGIPRPAGLRSCSSDMEEEGEGEEEQEEEEEEEREEGGGTTNMPGLGVGVGVGGGLLPALLFGGVLGAGLGSAILYAGALEEGLVTEDIFAEAEAGKTATPDLPLTSVKAASVMERRPAGYRGFAASWVQ
ncbi:hypothetical protein QJQ45_016656 [Haematococcus lacustris]|nr:hypothetical protein QJQ45_016656 [Haematococcus lacustris]